jgi:signal transduction histidine kinase
MPSPAHPPADAPGGGAPLLLDEFVLANRATIIDRTRARLAARQPDAPFATGVPAFLDQLSGALRMARSSAVVDHQELDKAASLHGERRLQMGVPIAQVVRDYGDVCQTITELAIERESPMSGAEFQTLNLCLDDAIAHAVTAYSHQKARDTADRGTERLGAFAHELRNRLNSAMLAFEIIKSGRVSPSGSTGLVLGRALIGLRDLIDRSLADVRLDAGIERRQPIAVADLVEEVEIAAAIEADAKGVKLEVGPVDAAVIVLGDRQLLVAALSNLLQNAFKFTRPKSLVRLSTRATAEAVTFDVEDECGGLPAGKTADLFRAFEQRGTDRSGVGLGLSICRKAAEANGGELGVRDLPGKGCIFTLSLPRAPSRPA